MTATVSTVVDTVLYDPWAQVPMGITVISEAEPGIVGSWCQTTRTIRLHPDLNERQRRSVLTHELVHAERGHHGPQPEDVELEVRQEAARRLLPGETLREALADLVLDKDNIISVAAALNCRPIDIRTRLADLTWTREATR